MSGMTKAFHTITRIEQRFTVPFHYPVIFSRKTLELDNMELADLVSPHGQQALILPVFDSRFADANPTIAQKFALYCHHHDLNALAPIIVPGGEACKYNAQAVDQVYQAVVNDKIDRHSYIAVFGGGAVIDAIGYAAATAHRGIRLIRFPTTVLAQNDAAVGVKNAINYTERKNFLGTFEPPYAVICDFDFLETLENRDKRAGIAEAIKVALIKDADFFEKLYAERHLLARFDAQAMENMIIKGAQWHLDHIAHQGDPFEMGSSRPLDFGHWSAHKLEEITQHELRHGEAVAIGIAMDSLYSYKVGRIDQQIAERILTLLTDLGFNLYHPAMDTLDIPQALHEFKEHLGGELCISLLNGIGQSEEVHRIDAQLMTTCLQTLKP